MLVISKARGYFNGIREPGQKFEVPEGSKGSWFEPVDKPSESKPSRKTKSTEDDGEKSEASDIE